ncbi:MAG: glycoside hydrolase family 13 protein [Bacteroidota bacterium]
MNKILITALALFCFNGLFGQSYPDSLYNEEEMQKFPLGVEEAHYHKREATGGTVDQTRVEPPFWWTGMTHKDLQILIYDQDIKGAEASIDYPGVKLVKTQQVENPNYLFLDLVIDKNTKPGKFKINLTTNGGIKSYDYELMARRSNPYPEASLSSADLIYLIMPDRFANGDTNNDSFDDMNQWGINREKPLFRHGGDLMGIMERMDYVEDLGVTALWLNPVLENDQLYESYHGYAITDHYNIDKRFGSNENYKQLIDLGHERGIKMIQDVIYNHVGDQHWLIKDLPSKDFIHQFEEYTKTTYRAPTLMDPYVANGDKEQFNDGWFDNHMPDLNQKNPLVSNYLIQNTFWWVEYANLDGLRIDTYAYSDQGFMADLGKYLQEEYPNFMFFGETWVHGSPIQAQFTQNNELRAGYNSYLPSVTDFQMYYAITDALNRTQGWTDGIAKVYYTLTKDFIYEDPYRNVIFLDNHDLSRFYTVVDGNMNKFKSGISFLLTMRGIPMLNYGTEILLGGAGGGSFGEAGRKDFPGGWENDSTDKFKTENLSEKEKDAFNHITTLANYRKNNPVLQNGQLTHFIPENDIYVFFRHNADKKVMVIMNTANEARNVSMDRYKNQLKGYSKALEVCTDKTYNSLDAFELPANGTMVLELGK